MNQIIDNCYKADKKTGNKIFALLYVSSWKVCLTFVSHRIIIEMESKLSSERSKYVKNRLEDIRKEKGIKQEELATALKVSRQTIGSLENGRYNPSIVLAFKIARFFNMKIEEIFIYEEDEQ